MKPRTPIINAITKRIGRGLPIGLAEAEAWRELDILVVRMDDTRLTEHERFILAIIGSRLHGLPSVDTAG